MLVFMEDAAESVASSDGEVVVLPRIRGWYRRWLEGAGVGDALVGSVGVVVFLELPQGVEQVVLVPDQGAVEEFASAGLHPAFHDRVHARDSDAAEYDR
jgi:hypothetical protein